jgi:hypothetical protein
MSGGIAVIKNTSQVEGNKIDNRKRHTDKSQQRVENPENGGQTGHQNIPGFAMIAENGIAVGDDAPQRFDKPADLSQCIKKLTPGVSHSECEFYKI